VSTILRWWTRQEPTAALRALAAMLVVLLLAVTGIGALADRPTGAARPVSVAAPSPTPPGQPEARAAPAPRGAAAVPSPVPGWRAEPSGDFVGWAIADYGETGITVYSSDNATELSTTASMIKAWIAADYLRRTAEADAEPGPTRLAELTEVIRDSDNAYAQTIFQELGAHESIARLIDICGLRHARASLGRWSNTLLSPVDAALMGVCIADGRAAGAEWTEWLLDEMRLVRGRGDFGIRDALPAQQRSSVAIKNGWVERTDQDAWHVNCLAIGDSWTMGVMTRYPAELGYEHGAEVCRSLATEHLPIPGEATWPDQPESGPRSF
jgi:hypothetical protein